MHLHDFDDSLLGDMAGNAFSGYVCGTILILLLSSLAFDGDAGCEGTLVTVKRMRMALCPAQLG